MHETSFSGNKMSSRLGRKSVQGFQLILLRKSYTLIQTYIPKVEKCNQKKKMSFSCKQRVPDL